MVSILHISDLHFTRDAAMHNMRQVLIDEARAKVHDKPKGEKLLIVTGDFHNFWAPDYQDAIKFLSELTAAMDINPKEDVFIIPGNHDVADDKVLEPIIKDAIPDWKKHKSAALRMIASGDFSFLDWRMEMFIPYCQFAREIGIYPKATDIIQDTQPAHVHIRCWRNKLNILHLNTALIADGKAKDNQFADITTATDPELWAQWYREDVPALALGHNSFYDLSEDHQLALETVFAQKNISAYLCGDTHLKNIFPTKARIPIIDNEIPIPNVVCAKSVADMTDTYSDFGYYWHEWDEKTDEVRAVFFRWRKEYRAETATEGIPIIYKMRHTISKKPAASGDGLISIDTTENSDERLILEMKGKLPFLPGLLEYIYDRFAFYKEADIAVYTPQMLLMLLEYPDSEALRIFNNYRFEETYYGDYLIQTFRYIDQVYRETNRTYNPNSHKELAHIVSQFQPEKWDSYITERTLCYAIMVFGGNTVTLIKEQLGDNEFNSLIHYLKLGRPQSVSLKSGFPSNNQYRNP